MIGKALRLTREFHRMKQGELARKLGISTSYLSEIENEKKNASLELLEQYSAVFGVPASTFLLFKERLNGEPDVVVRDHAARLLDFFAWVIDDDENNGQTSRATLQAAGVSKKAVRVA